MAQRVCEQCGQDKSGVSNRVVYYCKKCGRTGCWASGPFGGLISEKSCLPDKCIDGKDHDKITKYYVG